MVLDVHFPAASRRPSTYRLVADRTCAIRSVRPRPSAVGPSRRVVVGDRAGRSVQSQSLARYQRASRRRVACDRAHRSRLLPSHHAIRPRRCAAQGQHLRRDCPRRGVLHAPALTGCDRLRQASSSRNASRRSAATSKDQTTLCAGAARATTARCCTARAKITARGCRHRHRHGRHRGIGGRYRSLAAPAAMRSVSLSIELWRRQWRVTRSPFLSARHAVRRLRDCSNSFDSLRHVTGTWPPTARQHAGIIGHRCGSQRWTPAPCACLRPEWSAVHVRREAVIGCRQNTRLFGAIVNVSSAASESSVRRVCRLRGTRARNRHSDIGWQKKSQPRHRVTPVLPRDQDRYSRQGGEPGRVIARATVP